VEIPAEPMQPLLAQEEAEAKLAAVLQVEIPAEPMQPLLSDTP